MRPPAKPPFLVAFRRDVAAQRGRPVFLSTAHFLLDMVEHLLPFGGAPHAVGRYGLLTAVPEVDAQVGSEENGDDDKREVDAALDRHPISSTLPQGPTVGRAI